MVLDPGELWPLAPKRLTWGQIWRLIPDSPIHCASSLFLQIEAICLSLGARPAKAKRCTFDQKVRKFCIDDVIWPWKCWPRVTKFAPQRVLMRAYPPPKFRASSVSGSRDSRGENMPPPSRARNSQTLSRGRVKKQNYHVTLKMFLLIYFFFNLNETWVQVYSWKGLPYV